jgi:hypothetical protein
MTEQKKKVSLASLMTPSKTVTIDYPEFSGMTIDLCFLAREELIKLRARCLSQKFNRKTRGFEEELDDDKFLIEYCKSVIKGWSGLKYKYLEKMLLVNLDGVDFDTWITETVGDLENFTKTK